MITDTKPLRQFAATYTCDHDNGVTGPLYYFALAGCSPGPYRAQRSVEAILDIADDGSLAGVELIDNMPPPPAGAQSIDAKDALLREAKDALRRIVAADDEFRATMSPAVEKDPVTRACDAARSLLLKLTEATKP